MECTSSFLIYLATCKKCKGQYVGKSQTPFKMRHSNHKQEIKKQIGGLGQHYGGSGCGYSNLSIQLIEKVKEGDSKTLEILAKPVKMLYSNGGYAHCRRKEK